MDIRILRFRAPDPTPSYPVPNSDLTFELWLEFEYWEPQPDDDPETNFFNMQIALSDGRRYALNVWTYGYLNVAHQDDITSGANLHGAYLFPPDLFASALDRALVAALVTDLIQRDRLCEHWRTPADRVADIADGDAGDAQADDPVFGQFVAEMRAEGRIIEDDEGETAS